MQRVKKSARRSLFCSGLLGVFLMAGCSPDGAKLLLEGDHLLREGKSEAALSRLQQAVQLLPKNARAWNHLGLAQHQNRQSAEAVKSYQRALQLDPALTEARYNLGCLYLEMNKPAEAASELASYTVFHRDSVEGWVKLGYAQLRSSQLPAAQKSFARAYQLSPQSPDVLNGLGMIHIRQQKVREAGGWFSAALQQKKDFAPALLNLAVLTQQHSTNHAAALKLYRDYLALNPRPANWMAVDEVARRLDAELHPSTATAPAPTRKPDAPVVAVTTPAATVSPPSANAALPPATPEPAPVQTIKPEPPKIVAVAPAPAPDPKPAEKPIVTTKAPPQPPASVSPASVPAVVMERPRPSSTVVVVRPPPLPATPPVVASTAPRANPDVDPTPPKTQSAPPSLPEPVRPAASQPVQPAKAETEPAKPGFWDRMNPLRLFRTPEKPATPLPGDPTKRTTPMASASTPAAPAIAREIPISNDPPPVAPSKTAPVRTTVPEPEKPAPPPIIRYRYISPSAPAAGDRTKAGEHYKKGMLALRAGRHEDATRDFREATIADPSYFDAQSNLAVAALQAGELKTALSASEHALTLQPGSATARNNFALALQRANYPLDAALELRKVLAIDPENEQAHFALGGLYARQLNDAARAREHYRKVLELNPRHPQAEAIRYWLAAQTR